MKRNSGGNYDQKPAKKIARRLDDQVNCLLDLTIASNLLSNKVSDIPQKHKYEIIIKPLFEYCFGTSDDNSVWENLSDEELELYNSGKNIFESAEMNYERIELKIDWIRDGPFIHDQISDLVIEKLDILAKKFGLWKNRSFVFTMIEYYYMEILSKLDCFRNDREVVMASVKEYGKNLRFASNDLRNDFEIVKMAVGESGTALEYASDELRNNKEIVLTAVSRNGCALQFASDKLRNKSRVVKAAVKENGVALYSASERLKNNKKIVMLALDSNNAAYGYLSTLKDDRDVIFKAFSKDIGFNLSFASKLFCNDREFLLMISKLNGISAITYASRKLRMDREIGMQAVQQDPLALKYVSDELKNDKNLVLNAIQQNPEVYKYASYELRKDREIIKVVVRKDGHYLKKLSKEYRDDNKIAELAVKSNASAIDYISDRLRNSVDFLSKVFGEKYVEYLPSNSKAQLKRKMKRNPQYLAKYTYTDSIEEEEIKTDKKFIRELVSENGIALQFVRGVFKKDRKIVKAAVSNNGNAMFYASPEFWDDARIVLKASKTATNPNFYNNISERLKNDRSFHLKLIKHAQFSNYSKFSRKLQRDLEIIMKSVERNPVSVFSHLPPKFKVKDRVLALRAVKPSNAWSVLGLMCVKYRNDREIVSIAVRNNEKALKYASNELRNDTEILDLCKNNTI